MSLTQDKLNHECANYMHSWELNFCNVQPLHLKKTTGIDFFVCYRKT
jgi:hypothetical protein